MKIYVDIDGVLAVYQNPYIVYGEDGIFRRLPTIRGSHYFLEILKRFTTKNGMELIALSKTFIPEKHLEDKQDKVWWINEHFPGVFKNVIIQAQHETKSIYANQYSILIDDYGKNCMEWKIAGGLAIQVFEKKEKAWITCEGYKEIIEFFVMLDPDFSCIGGRGND